MSEISSPNNSEKFALAIAYDDAMNFKSFRNLNSHLKVSISKC